MEELHVLNSKVDNLSDTVVDIKKTVKELTNVIIKLTLIEERQINTVTTIEKLSIQMERIQDRLSELEAQMPANSRTAAWVDKAIWAGLGVLGVLIIKKIGILT